MDVQSISAAGGSAGTATATPGTSVDTSGSAAPASQGAQQTAVASPFPTEKHHDGVSTLKDPVQRLYGGGADLEITFRVEHSPNQIVTVFRDSKTGEEIAQFPAEIMVQLAQFFQKLAGGVVDRSA